MTACARIGQRRQRYFRGICMAFLCMQRCRGGCSAGVDVRRRCGMQLSHVKGEYHARRSRSATGHRCGFCGSCQCPAVQCRWGRRLCHLRSRQGTQRSLPPGGNRAPFGSGDRLRLHINSPSSHTLISVAVRAAVDDIVQSEPLVCISLCVIPSEIHMTHRTHSTITMVQLIQASHVQAPRTYTRRNAAYLAS